jgi:hypothetical protein
MVYFTLPCFVTYIEYWSSIYVDMYKEVIIMKQIFITLFSVIIISGCTNAGENILSQDVTQPKQEHFEGEIELVMFSMRSDLFKESESLQMFPIPDSAILVDKIHKYATFDLKGNLNLSDLMPFYLQEIQKMGWSEVEHSGQRWVFEKEGVQVKLSIRAKSLTVREIIVYSTMHVETFQKEKAIKIAENVLPVEYTELVTYSSILENNVWVVRFREKGDFGLKSCSIKINAISGEVLDKVCAE